MNIKGLCTPTGQHYGRIVYVDILHERGLNKKSEILVLLSVGGYQLSLTMILYME